jgi:hypothetical protein
MGEEMEGALAIQMGFNYTPLATSMKTTSRLVLTFFLSSLTVFMRNFCLKYIQIPLPPPWNISYDEKGKL